MVRAIALNLPAVNNRKRMAIIISYMGGDIRDGHAFQNFPCLKTGGNGSFKKNVFGNAIKIAARIQPYIPALLVQGIPAKKFKLFFVWI